MRLTAEQLAPLGEDAQPIHFIDTAFLWSEAPQRVGVAVSGGGDSMALLHMASVWSGLTGIPVEAVTVNHGLRAEAEDEAAMVKAYCGRLGVPHTTLNWDGTRAVGNLMAAARDARYDLIGTWAAESGVEGVLIGHTVDDVAETFLMRLARKSGVEGLAAMPPRFRRDDIPFCRPLWQFSREDLRDYARRHEVPWVDDPTNKDERFDRVKARKALATLAPLGISADVLKTVAQNLYGASVALEHYTFEEARRHVKIEAGDVLLPLRPRPPLPEEVKRRLMRAALRFVSSGTYAPRESALENLELALLSQARHTAGGCLVTKEGDMLRITREVAACEGPVAWANRTVGKRWDGRWLVSEKSDHNETAAPLEIRALGDVLSQVPNWRETGLPRSSLMATPAVFDGDTMIAAPVAGLQKGFEARIVADFASFLESR